MPVRCSCLICGKVFYKPPFTVKDGRGKYCSKPCNYAALSIKYKGRPGWVKSGPQNTNWKGIRVERPCPVCGTLFKSAAYTCSSACGQRIRSKKISGPNNPFAKAHPKKLRVCRGCGNTYSRGVVNGSTLGAGKTYCSSECSFRGLFRSSAQDYINNTIRGWGIETVMEKSWPWLVSPHSKCRMRVDIFIPSLNLAIEYDGRQHNELAFARGEDALIKIKERDARKEVLLKEAGVGLIRLSGWPVDMIQVRQRVCPDHPNIETHEAHPHA